MTTEIPAYRSSTGAFYTTFLETEKRVRDLVGAIVQKGGEQGTDEGRIAAFYKAYMDRQAIDAAGMKPFAADLARFAAKIGRAACRERGCKYVLITVGAVSLKKKQQ